VFGKGGKVRYLPVIEKELREAPERHILDRAPSPDEFLLYPRRRCAPQRGSELTRRNRSYRKPAFCGDYGVGGNRTRARFQPNAIEPQRLSRDALSGTGVVGQLSVPGSGAAAAGDARAKRPDRRNYGIDTFAV
jgi:hypothetical protein